MLPALLALALSATDPASAPAPAPPEAAAATPAAPATSDPSTPPTDPVPRAPGALNGSPGGHVLAPAAAVAGKRRDGFFLPVAFYTPETSFGAGAASGLHFQLDGARRPSSVFASLAYTLGGQGALDLATETSFRSGLFLNARSRLVYFPDVYYGLGPRTHEAARETFDRRSAELVATLEVPVPGVPGLRVGPRLDARAEGVGARQAGKALARETVTGWDGFRAASVGGSITWDTRDNTLWTTRGAMVQSWYVYAPTLLGPRRAFGRGVLEGRTFLPLGRGRTLGFHAYAEGVHGDPPFTLLPKLGSTRFLRGIREGRYRDRLDWAAQTELRVPIRGRLSGVAFAALGDVAPSFRALRLSTVKPAAGAGLRWRLTDEGANVRLDVAASGLGVEFYVLILEAF